MTYKYVTTEELIARGDHAANLRDLEVLLEDLTLADHATKIVLAAADEIDRLKALVNSGPPSPPCPGCGFFAFHVRSAGHFWCEHCGNSWRIPD